MGHHGKRKTEGQSLVEVLVGIAIASVITGTAVTGIVLTARSNQQGIFTQAASSLGQELLDNTRSFAEASWYDLYMQSDKTASSTYYFTGTSTLTIASGTEEVAIGNATYTRWISIENVNRDDCGTGDISTSVPSGSCLVPGNVVEDPSTQKITAWVEWPFRGDVARVTLVEYLTRWPRHDTVRFTDWSGSFGVSGPVTDGDANYFSMAGLDASTTGDLVVDSGETTGSLESSTYDTGLINGVKLHAILWQGTAGGSGSAVRFQIASANCEGGETNPPDCTTSSGWGGAKTSGDGAFVGSDGTSSSFYGPVAPDMPHAIEGTEHNNKRYVRYVIEVDKGTSSPTVEDIVIGWTP